VDLLISEATRALGKDAGFLCERLEIRRREGDPNWDADIGISEPDVVAAFGCALSQIRRAYDLE
jgi:hypothetical protein